MKILRISYSKILIKKKSKKLNLLFYFWLINKKVKKTIKNMLVQPNLRTNLPMMVTLGPDDRKLDKRIHKTHKIKFLFGIFFIILSMVLLTCELARLFTGSLNKNPITSYGLYPNNIYYPPFYRADTTFNIERRHQYMWPWSSPTLIFSILV
jgi:hypothetical protein